MPSVARDLDLTESKTIGTISACYPTSPLRPSAQRGSTASAPSALVTASAPLDTRIAARTARIIAPRQTRVSNRSCGTHTAPHQADTTGPRVAPAGFVHLHAQGAARSSSYLEADCAIGKGGDRAGPAAGTSAGRPRCFRMRRMTRGCSISAMSSRRPPSKLLLDESRQAVPFANAAHLGAKRFEVVAHHSVQHVCAEVFGLNSEEGRAMPQMSRRTRHKAWNANCSGIHATCTRTPWHPRGFRGPRSPPAAHDLLHRARPALHPAQPSAKAG